jgi:hypothetical protein
MSEVDAVRLALRVGHGLPGGGCPGLWKGSSVICYTVAGFSELLSPALFVLTIEDAAIIHSLPDIRSFKHAHVRMQVKGPPV